jgi:hypothetical protein
MKSQIMQVRKVLVKENEILHKGHSISIATFFWQKKNGNAKNGVCMFASTWHIPVNITIR